MNDNSIMLPVIPLRNMAVLPGMLIHFDVNRKRSIAGIERAMQENQSIFLVTQINSENEKPGLDDLCKFGTVSTIKQMIKLPGGIIRVLVFGNERGRLLGISEEEPFLFGEIEKCPMDQTALSDADEEAMLRSLKDILEVYTTQNGRLNPEIVKQLMCIDELPKLLEQIAIQIPLTVNERQSIMETGSFYERFQKIAVILSDEIEIMRIKRDIQEKVKGKVDKNQKEYIMREQMKVIREELGESDTVSDIENFLAQADQLIAHDAVKARIKKEIERFRSIAQNSAEAPVVRSYIETLLELPWDKASEEKADIKNARFILERDHYGLKKVKERILEFLAVRTLTTKGESPIICLVGPPGTGKTSIARSVAESLNKEYVRICLGGVRDEAEIRGHRRTYVGALPGRIVMGLRGAGVKNPLMLLDEIDKISSDYKGDTSSALLEVLDSEQNSRFVDHYVEIPIDLSEVMFVATANTTQTIPKPLLDRMELIEVSSYTENEKLHIALNHLIAKQQKKNGLTSKQISMSKKAIEQVISGYTKEAGVRSLERRIGELCRKAAKELLEHNMDSKIKITDKNLDQYLGKPKYVKDKVNKLDEKGIVQGLAWTSVGGDILQIEVNTMPGKGKFELTGQLGDVMKESAKTGISYIRSVSEQYRISSEFFEKNDIHIHIPEGAVPKDGPSAGITMATAMISAITGHKIRAELAMTGEITLRGRVLPVGGLKEKILAAKAFGVKQVLIPDKNRRDIVELEQEVLDGIQLEYVATMEDVLHYALVTEREDQG